MMKSLSLALMLVASCATRPPSSAEGPSRAEAPPGRHDPLALVRVAEGADDDTRRLVRYGASIRAGQAVVLAAKVRALIDGRPSVSQEDLDRCMLPALRHRVVLTFEAEAEERDAQSLLSGWLDTARRRAF